MLAAGLVLALALAVDPSPSLASQSFAEQVKNYQDQHPPGSHGFLWHASQLGTCAAYDYVSTQHVLAQPGGRELNPLLRNQYVHAVIRFVTVTTVSLLARYLGWHGHTNAAKALTWGGCGVYIATGTWNFTLPH